MEIPKGSERQASVSIESPTKEKPGSVHFCREDVIPKDTPSRNEVGYLETKVF